MLSIFNRKLKFFVLCCIIASERPLPRKGYGMLQQNWRCAGLFFLFFFFLSGCTGHYLNWNDPALADAHGKMSTINLKDGVDYDEALIILKNHLPHFGGINLVRSFSIPQEERFRWRITVTGRHNYLQMSDTNYDIYISKLSGHIYTNTYKSVLPRIEMPKCSYTIDESTGQPVVIAEIYADDNP